MDIILISHCSCVLDPPGNKQPFLYLHTIFFQGLKYFNFDIIFISKKVNTPFLVWIVPICMKIIEVISRNS